MALCDLEMAPVDWHTQQIVVAVLSMKHFVPIMVAVGLLVLVSVLVVFWKPRDPTSSPVPAKSVGTSTLSHGGPAPTR
jgi:hypothetical protein